MWCCRPVWNGQRSQGLSAVFGWVAAAILGTVYNHLAAD
jgi:hypothetical protein